MTELYHILVVLAIVAWDAAVVWAIWRWVRPSWRRPPPVSALHDAAPLRGRADGY